MPVQITPGYDFAVTEIPTKANLQAMAAGLSITGIPLSQFAVTLNIISINDTTSVSNLPNEGSLWVDQHGNIWGRTRFGDLKVRKYDGGWESNRFRSIGLSGTAGNPFAPGRPARIAEAVALGTNVTEAVVAFGGQRSDNGQELHCFVAQDTSASQAIDDAQYFRYCGRGMTRFFTHIDTSPSLIQQVRLKYNPGAATNWITEDMFDNSTNIQAEGAELAVNGSPTEVRAYYFGYLLRNRTNP